MANENNKLISEIRNLIHKGVSHDVIVSQFIRKGLSQKYIEEMINYVMVQELHNQKLYDSQTHETYSSITNGKNVLNNQTNSSVNQSIDSNSINNNINNNNNNNINNNNINNNNNASSIIKIEHTHKFSFGSMVFIMLFFILLASTFFVAFQSQGKSESYLLDYELKLIKTNYSVGDSLEFTTKYSNMGTNKDYDVFTTYKIMDSNDSIIMQWTETKAVSNVQNYHIMEKIPEYVKSGRYYIASEVDYGVSQKAVARSLYFQIYSFNDELDNQNNYLFNDSVDDAANNNITNNNINIAESSDQTTAPTINEVTNEIDNEVSNEIENINNSTSNNISTVNPLEEQEMSQVLQEQDDFKEKILSTIEQAKELSLMQPTEAGKKCLSLNDNNLIDSCFQQLAKYSKNYNFCAEIKDYSSSDFCYINYVVDTRDYEKCDFITVDKTKRSCYYLNPNYQGEAN